jgi:FMN-dependent oxidoreductase (nitrilotriacetate monooxygenase family)
MHLMGFLCAGPTVFHLGTWRHPQSDPRVLETAFSENVARTLEAAKFDAVFFQDGIGFQDEASVARGGLIPMLDPVPLTANILRATTNIGVGVTVSTSFYGPYHIARSLGTIDYLSGGRLAWNVVTSVLDAEAQFYGLEEIPDRESRYSRAADVVEATIQLWESFGPDALIADKQSGEYIDPAKLNWFDYRGDFVRTKGPLSVPPSPQGRPIIMQAGQSESGRQFAARFAEVIFSIATTPAGMKAFYSDMKRRVVEAGRSPEDCTILPLVQVYLGESEAIARERMEYIDRLIDEDAAISWASASTGIDFGAFSPDEPLEVVEDYKGSRAFQDFLNELQDGEEKTLTLREAARSLSGSAGFPTLIGTPEQVADQMQAIFEDEGADGFMIGAPVMPGTFEEFARAVVPILQRRGLFRREYPGTTLRETLRS